MVFFHFGKYLPFSIICPITTYIILFQHSTFPELTSPKCCDFSSALTHLCTWSSWQRGEALKRWTLIVYNKISNVKGNVLPYFRKKHINLLHPGGESTGSLCGQCVGTEGKQWYEINLWNVYQTVFSKHFFLGRIYQIQIWPKVIQPRSSRWWRLKALPHLHFRFSLFHRLRLKTEAILRPSRETLQWRIPTVLLTWEMWWLQTPSSLKLLQRGRWTKRVTGELEEIWKESQRFGETAGMYLTCSIWPLSTTKHSPNWKSSW